MTMRVPGCVRALVITVLLFAQSAPIEAASTRVFSLPREGSASMVLSESSKAAVLLDGGQTSSKLPRGLAIDGEPVLRWLHAHGYRSIVIICSHPHADHLLGLLKVVRHQRDPTKPGDVDLTQFERVVLVDSGYGGKTLAQAFVETHGPRDNVTHINATNLDIATHPEVAAMFGRAGDLQVSTLRYEPLGTSPHGHAVITLFRMTDTKGNITTYIDPDDTDNRTLESVLPQYGQSIGGKIVLSASHHGSRFMDLEAVARIVKPDFILFQANDANRFDHPHAETWAKAVAMVGIERVYITGSGADLTFDATGPQPLTKEQIEAIVTRVLVPKVERLDREMIELRDDESDTRKSSALRARRKRLETRADALRYLALKYKDHLNQQHARIWVMLFPPRDEAAGGPVTPRPPRLPSGDAGGDEPFLPGPPEPRPTPPSLGPPGGSRDIVNGVSDFTILSAKGRGAGFQQLTTGLPTFGGVVIGNEVRGGAIQSAAFEIVKDSIAGVASDVPVLRVHVGEEAYEYSDWTMTELWSAYRFAEEGSSGLVGISGDASWNWSFGIHPAIADTSLARDAMAVDMLFSILPRQDELSKLVPRCFKTYQWFDVPTCIKLSDHAVFVEPCPEGMPSKMPTVLTIRFLCDDTPDAVATLEPGQAIDFQRLAGRAAANDGFVNRYPPRKLVVDANARFAPVRRIDRFARAVAVLTWLRAQNQLPELPAEVQPRHVSVDGRLSRRGAARLLGLDLPLHPLVVLMILGTLAAISVGSAIIAYRRRRRRVTCPQCAVTLKYRPRAGATKIRCPRCGHTFDRA